MPPGPIPVVVVSSWYPSVTDPVAGRFVADQVAALAARDEAAPAVVSFDPADLIGSGPVRARIAGTIASHVGAAVRSERQLFQSVPASGQVVPVARLGIPSGRHRGAGPTHALAARLRAIDALADRWLGGAEAAIPRPELVHAHTVYPDGAAAARLARRLDCPLVLTEHASAVERLIAAPEVRAAYLETVAAAARLIVVSRWLADELTRSMPEIASKVIVIPNSVATHEFRAAPNAERRAGELLFVGYRKESKGIETLLRAAAAVAVTHPGVTVRLIGGSPTATLEAGWRRLADELGIAPIVTFEGPADRRAVAEAMARASLFVHPSPRETFGVVAVEALASGLPVIATDSGGVTEILGTDASELGGIVPVGRADLLAAAIARALDARDAFDPDRLRGAVETRFGAAAVAGRVEAVYREALGAAEVPARAAPEARAQVAPPHREPVAPAVPARARRLLVVALDPTRAAEVVRTVGAQGAAVHRDVAMVTSAETPLDPDAPLRVVRTRPGLSISGLADAAVLRSGPGGWRRWLQLARHPMALARRRGWLGGLEAAAAAGDAAIRAALAGGRGERPMSEDPAEVEIVCADGIDHLAAAAVLAEGICAPAPGGVRWLGDILASGVTPEGR